MLCLALAAAVSAAFVWFCWRRGYTLYYGDAAAHINIARRVIDSRTPGYKQLGTVWLPLPHVMMLPLVRYDSLWRSGLAGAIPAAVFFVAGTAFLFAAVRRATGNLAAATTAAALLALNPNLLYLQATPMTEPFFIGCFAAGTYFCVRWQEQRKLRYAVAAGFAVLAASVTRYEAWLLIPLFALFFFLTRSLAAPLLFLVIACLGPLYWLGHNYYWYDDALEFFQGPHSAKAIYFRGLAQGGGPHPGDHDLRTAWLYYRRAMELTMGRPLLWVAAGGALIALLRRATWPLLLLAVPVPFYLASIHSGGTPIFIPKLHPFSYYNTRYALAALPACAAAAGILVALIPKRPLRAAVGAAVLAVCLGGWVLHPSVESWLCWKESEVNSRGRRAWTREMAEFFRRRYTPGDGILTPSGDVMAVYQEAGIPLRETLNDGNFLQFWPAMRRPDLFLRERWIVAYAGDDISFNLTNPKRYAWLADRMGVFSGEREPVLEIYRKVK